MIQLIAFQVVAIFFSIALTLALRSPSTTTASEQKE